MTDQDWEQRAMTRQGDIVLALIPTQRFTDQTVLDLVNGKGHDWEMGHVIAALQNLKDRALIRRLGMHEFEVVRAGVLKVNVTLPIYLKSEANARSHWAAKARRVRAHRTAAKCALMMSMPKPDSWKKTTVTITRVARPHRSLDSDNLAMAGKGLRDGIADAMKVDDADPRVSWVYLQRLEEGKSNDGREYGLVEINVEIQ